MHRRGRVGVIAGVAVAAVVGVACGTTDKASQDRLPPIRTTIPTTSTTSTTIPAGDIFYTVKSGDTLGKIAEGFQVPVLAIVELNGLANQDAIQAGQTLQIPTGVILVAELPNASADTTEP
ncbi:MAG: LysM peptidoglycan-binding domain-containing protein [Ilumatobacteraceae bacterium]